MFGPVRMQTYVENLHHHRSVVIQRSVCQLLSTSAAPKKTALLNLLLVKTESQFITTPSPIRPSPIMEQLGIIGSIMLMGGTCRTISTLLWITLSAQVGQVVILTYTDMIMVSSFPSITKALGTTILVVTSTFVSNYTPSSPIEETRSSPSLAMMMSGFS